MAQYEDEKKSEAEMKKSYQATLIPKEQGEESETESEEIELTSEEPEKEAEGAISNLMPEESEKEQRRKPEEQKNPYPTLCRKSLRTKGQNLKGVE